MQTAYFAGGCFWCVEAIFQRINGVKELINGYGMQGSSRAAPWLLNFAMPVNLEWTA